VNAGVTLNNAKDLHFLFNAAFRQLRCHGGAGEFHWSIEARGEGSFADQKRKNGNTPFGRYWCGTPLAISPGEVDSPSYGLWFIPLAPEAGVAPGRTGFGIHGGGKDLQSPLAALQGWETTYGCIRVQNAELSRIVKAINFTSTYGGAALLTVDWASVWRPDALKYVSPVPRQMPQDVGKRSNPKA
jgi:hypothetical protein